MPRLCRADSRRHERGATATEYALLVSLIALAIIAMVWAMGTNLSGVYGRSCDDLATATNRTC
jgi:pilus assembly protein Flp/PilA